jgi:cell division protein FtsZ
MSSLATGPAPADATGSVFPTSTSPANTPTSAASRAPLATAHATAAGTAELPLNLHAAKTAQDEFLFGEIERRGFFDKTDRNLFEGQDLDVPTYLRKGIKIAF